MNVLPMQIIEVLDGLFIGGIAVKMRHSLYRLYLEDLIEIHKNPDKHSEYRAKYYKQIIYISQHDYDEFMKIVEIFIGIEN